MKAGTVKEGALELVDGEVVNISDDDADVFNIVLEDLTEENRDLMLIRMHEGVDSYEQMLSFAREYAYCLLQLNQVNQAVMSYCVQQKPMVSN